MRLYTGKAEYQPILCNSQNFGGWEGGGGGEGEGGGGGEASPQ